MALKAHIGSDNPSPSTRFKKGHKPIKLGRANASRAGLDAALRWIEECRRLGWPESQFDDLESLWWEHHDKDGNLNPPNDKLSDRASKT